MSVDSLSAVITLLLLIICMHKTRGNMITFIHMEARGLLNECSYIHTNTHIAYSMYNTDTCSYIRTPHTASVSTNVK